MSGRFANSTFSNNLFERSHIQGYRGIKSKFLEVTREHEPSFNTSFYRIENEKAMNRTLSPDEDRRLASLGFTSQKA